jgi:PHP family Zn ribbon phosphoesterase
MTWFRMDLHLHTPASADYQDLTATYLEILQKAEGRSLDIIAFTDHNSVSGIAAMRREIEDLELLEEMNRLQSAEWKILEEYRRLMEKVLVLPGFEFTAAFGFHILGIFPPETTVRRLEHVLMTLNVPEEQMEAGSGQVGATADVLAAYEVINENGGLVIPAHVDSTHGVAMQGFRFGGQTKIAYTQSEYIHALEVTDLDDMTRRATASFFNGSKPEYPRRMHCIQGSDAHRLTREGARRDTDLGIGDRATEALLPERAFTALKALLISEDFARTRPYQPVSDSPFDAVQAAREQGATLVQAFHEQVRSRRSRYRPILKDVVALANTNGGTIYVGVNANPAQPPIGVPDPEESARGLRDALARSVVPKLDVAVDVESSGGKPVLIVSVPKGMNTPYATDAGQVFVRQESETVIALRDEIVQLVREAAGSEPTPTAAPVYDRAWTAPRASDSDTETDEPDAPDVADTTDLLATEMTEEPAVAAPTRTRRRPPRRRAAVNRDHAAATPEPATEQPQPTDTALPPEVDATLDVTANAPLSTTTAEPEPTQQQSAEPSTEESATPTASSAPEETAAPEASALVEETPPAKPRPRRRARTSRAAAPETVEPVIGSAAPEPTPVPEAQAVPVGASTPAVSRNGTELAIVPKTGVEILGVEERDGERYYTMRDLRSGRVAENVTRKSARRLWRQAIVEREKSASEADTIRWEGNLGYAGSAMRDGVRRYTLAYRENGDVRHFYAVSDDGINEAWRTLVGSEG